MKKLGWKIWLLLIVLGLSILAISPNFKTGVLIKSVEPNSTAFEQGLRSGEIIKSVNQQEITSLKDYSAVMSDLFSEQPEKSETIPEIIKTNKINSTENETNKTNQKNITETTLNTFTSKTKIIITTDQQEHILFTSTPPEITVAKIPSTKIQTGLDLQGGARALVSPETTLTSQEMTDLISVTSNRLNVFGISDVSIKPVRDLAGNTFMLVEIAGATPSDLRELVSKQGKFEAKVGNETVFIGGNKDVTSVCRNDATCAGIYSCTPSQEGYFCSFRFTVYLSEEAAKRHADITSKLGVNITAQGSYLDKKLDLYVDDSLLDSLLISSELKGQETTQISVQGSGTGSNQELAFDSASASMNKLQTILITGSLPYKLEIEKLDTISAVLGSQFIYYLALAGAIALLAVALIILIRYKSFKTSLAVLFVILSEIIIILGIASLIKWNLDIPSIAGILIVIGTGVDQLIIMTDESHSGRQGSISEKLKRALFIIIGAYFTSLASLIPLYWAGAGLLKGFAVTTIIGITTGVLITRPAFAEMLKKIES